VKTRGTPEQRREQRRQRRQANRVKFVRDRAQRSGSNHQLVVVACNAALATSRRITDGARRLLAQAIAQAVEAVDHPDNWKERS
jgi:hypothetical protein